MVQGSGFGECSQGKFMPSPLELQGKDRPPPPLHPTLKRGAASTVARDSDFKFRIQGAGCDSIVRGFGFGGLCMGSGLVQGYGFGIVQGFRLWGGGKHRRAAEIPERGIYTYVNV